MVNSSATRMTSMMSHVVISIVSLSSSLMSVAWMLWLIESTSSKFTPGKLLAGDHELAVLSGHHVLANAIEMCEQEMECAAFTFNGPADPQRLLHVAFFRYAGRLSYSFHDVAWTTYLVDRSFATYLGQYSANFSVVKDARNVEEVEQRCLDNHMCVAIAFSANHLGEIFEVRLHDFIDLDILAKNFSRSSSWTTRFKLSSSISRVQAHPIDLCCPSATELRMPSESDFQARLERVHCSMDKKEFTERYVRKAVPVILKECNEYNWLKDIRNNLSIAEVLNMFHPPLATTAVESKSWNQSSIVVNPGFTHIETPNSFVIDHEDVWERYNEGSLRDFIGLSGSAKRETQRQQTFVDLLRRPSSLPLNLFEWTSYESDLHWLIVSQEGTGSHLHVDPDLTSAYSIMLTVGGIKWWAILPMGIDPVSLHCTPECSENNVDDSDNTYVWFQHVLPQLRERTWYGGRVVESLQHVGEMLFLPHGTAHSVLNVKDNMAVTENLLLVDSLSELVAKMATDEIDAFSPDYSLRAFVKLHNVLMQRQDRRLMRWMYAQSARRMQLTPKLCHQADNYTSFKKHKMALS